MPADGKIWRPRCSVRLYVPNLGTASERTQQEELDDVFALQCRAHKIELQANSHMEADECRVSLAYDDAGIDPRVLKSAEMYVWLGNGDDRGEFRPTKANLRFIGIAVDVERDLSVSSGKNVNIRALDYTTLFLNCKQFVPAGLPRHQDTLRVAWERLCDFTGYYDIESRSVVSTVQRLKPKLEFVGEAAEEIEALTLGSAVSPRFAKFNGPVNPPHRDADAWAVWQTAVGSLGLISFIRGDRCIVTTATDFYTADDPPRMVFGENVYEIKETRDVQSLSAKGVCVRSFNATPNGRTPPPPPPPPAPPPPPPTNPSAGYAYVLEAFYPPTHARAPKQKRIAASALGSPQQVKSQNYEVFDCPFNITDQATLDRFAQRIWEERSRQELKGTLKTSEMFVDTLTADTFDMLGLQSGDRIRVEIDRGALTIIQALPTSFERQHALEASGYSESMAKFITTNLDSLTRMTPEFQVHNVMTTFDVQASQYEVTIQYLNRIDVSGSAQPGTGVATVALTGQKK